MAESPKRRRSLFAKPRSPPKAVFRKHRATLGEELPLDPSLKVWKVPEVLPPPPKIFVQPPTPLSTRFSLSPQQTECEFKPSAHLKPPPRDYNRALQKRGDFEKRPTPVSMPLWPKRVSSSQKSKPDTQSSQAQAQPLRLQQHCSSASTTESQHQSQEPHGNHLHALDKPQRLQPLPPASMNPTIDDIRRLKYDIWTLATSTWDPWYNHSRFPKHILAVEAPLQHEPFRKEVYEKMIEIRQHAAELSAMLSIARREWEKVRVTNTENSIKTPHRGVGSELGD